MEGMSRWKRCDKWKNSLGKDQGKTIEKMHCQLKRKLRLRWLNEGEKSNKMNEKFSDKMNNYMVVSGAMHIN